MSVVDYRDRESRLKAFIRPLLWAYSLSFFCGVFGLIYTHYGFVDARMLSYGLSVVLLVNVGLLIWGITRVQNTARGRY